jgi:cell division protein ZapA
MAEPVEVVIMGQVFSVTSEDGEEHIRGVASYVDGKMREIAAGGKVISSFTAAVLAALNIASECQKLRQNAAETEAAIGRLTERLDAVSGEAAAGRQRRVVRNG